MSWTRRHLLGTEDLSREEIEAVLALARALSPDANDASRKREDLKGRIIANLFFEPSTHTKTTFGLAARRLGAEVLEYPVTGGGTGKDESTADTARRVAALGPDAVIVRSRLAGTPLLLTQKLSVSVVNAGDGAHEHPSQALVDLYTLFESFDTIADLHVVIVGDIVNSRIARSNLWALKTMGAAVTLCGPPPLVPRAFEALGARVCHELDAILEEADVVMSLGLQSAKHVADLVPSAREYSHRYGLSAARAESLKPHSLVLHSGPVRRGVEVSPSVIDGNRSAAVRQARNGVAVRMAVLKLCLEARGRE